MMRSVLTYKVVAKEAAARPPTERLNTRAERPAKTVTPASLVAIAGGAVFACAVSAQTTTPRRRVRFAEAHLLFVRAGGGSKARAARSRAVLRIIGHLYPERSMKTARASAPTSAAMGLKFGPGAARASVRYLHGP